MECIRRFTFFKTTERDERSFFVFFSTERQLLINVFRRQVTSSMGFDVLTEEKSSCIKGHTFCNFFTIFILRFVSLKNLASSF